MTFSDFILAAELDQNIFDAAQRKKLGLIGYVYFFDIELQNGMIEKGTTKWGLRRRFIDFIELDKNVSLHLTYFILNIY